MSGRVKAFHIDDNGIWIPRTAWQHNALTVEAGVIGFEALLRQDSRYVLNAMYIEFENLGNPNTNIDVSGIDATEGLDYYTNLSASLVKDYLRVPLSAGVRPAIIDGYEELLRDGQYNRGYVYVQTAGAVGINGKTFSSGANSKVYGVALVSAPVWEDRAHDVVYSRAYYSGSEQPLKTASREIGFSYDMKFKFDQT